MNILFVHQNFPGQLPGAVPVAVAQGGHQIVFLTQRKGKWTTSKGARVVTYAPHHKPTETAYAPTKYWEECVGNGLGAAFAAQNWRRTALRPM